MDSETSREAMEVNFFQIALVRCLDLVKLAVLVEGRNPENFTPSFTARRIVRRSTLWEMRVKFS